MIYIRKQIVILLISVLFIASFSGASTFNMSSFEIILKNSENQNYTHTVFAGIAATQSCGGCNEWNQKIYEEYISEEFDFEYISMIGYDENGNVLNYDAIFWSLNYTVGTFPTTIIDGDYERISGNYIEELPGALDSCGNRTVANINAYVSAILVGDATINITITIENNEATQYNGYIRLFISEIISRYNTSIGDPFHFGFLDFAFDESISISPGDIYTDHKIWNGYEHEDAHGDDFGDLKANNIQVALVLYNLSDGYVDETVIAQVPNNQPYKPIDPFPESGSVDLGAEVDLSWNCSDPDGDDLFYDVYLGTTNPPPLFATNVTEEFFDPGLLEFQSMYYWYIVSNDHRGGTNESSIWNFTTKINYIPEIPSTPFGPTLGNVGEELEYVTTTFEPDGDDLYYWFDWGNGNNSGWVGPFEASEIANASYIWSESGDYTIKVKAKDEYGYESKWSEGFDIYITEPNLEIDNISGGLFRIYADILNTGNGEAENIEWSIKLSSGLVFLGRETSDVIESILIENEEKIQSKLIFGIGKTEITIEANVQYGKSATTTIDAFLLGCYIWLR
ncbi:MAG: hypothetical protein JSU91_06440 [Thermoplasmatales archaeon]|nr:MAG: hypothetical protein JSU91_06440 [Thermoplasmatales archaeon]